jgi:hypothetical protein
MKAQKIQLYYAVMYRTHDRRSGVWRNKFFCSRKAAKDYLLQHEEQTIASWRHVWVEAFRSPIGFNPEVVK